MIESTKITFYEDELRAMIDAFDYDVSLRGDRSEGDKYRSLMEGIGRLREGIGRIAYRRQKAARS